jgi:hypothetical protein
MSQEEKRREARIQELEREIADLKARWPKHSVPPAMLMRLEELEEELGRLGSTQALLRAGSQDK